MNESFKFWEDMGLHVPNKEPILEWLEANAVNIMSDEDVEALENDICQYVFSKRRVDTVRHINSRFSKTYNERKTQALGYAAKLAVLLIEGMSTKKGKVLAEMLLDMHRNPQDYIYNVGKATHSRDNINSYIEAYKVPKDIAKELYKLL